MKTSIVLTCIALGAAVLAPGSVGEQSGPGAKKDIITTAVEDGNFNSFVAALGVADLAAALKGTGPFTVFAPTDEAFARVPDETLDALLEKENLPLLESLLTYHIVAGDLRAKHVAKLSHGTTLNGQRVAFAAEKSVLSVDGVEVAITDIECANGVIHVIESVLMPESKSLVGVATGAGTFVTFLAAVEAAGLTELLDQKGPFTLLVPTDEAFAALPEGTLETLMKPENKKKLVALLELHVIDGRVYADQAAKLEKAPTLHGAELSVEFTEESARIGNAEVIDMDVQASNGVLHVIDAVLVL